MSGKSPARQGRRLTYGNVIATIALFIALGGSAYALKAGSVGSKQLKQNAVKSKHVAKGQIKTNDIGKNAVKNKKIADGGVLEADLNGGAVSTDKLADGAVTPEKADLAGAFGSGILGTEVNVAAVGAGLAGLGSGPAIGAEGSDMDLLMPVQADVRNLVARATTVVAAGREIEVRIVKRGGGGTILSCTIPSGESTCSADGPGESAFAPGDRLGVDVFAGGGGGAPAIGATSYEVGYRLTPVS